MTGKVYGEFTSPNCDLASHRYFQEDIAHGLVLLHSLGETLGLATPLIDSVIAIASCIARTDYLKEARRTVHTLGLQVWIDGPSACILLPCLSGVLCWSGVLVNHANVASGAGSKGFSCASDIVVRETVVGTTAVTTSSQHKMCTILSE
jgi:hypothetical protein